MCNRQNVHFPTNLIILKKKVSFIFAIMSSFVLREMESDYYRHLRISKSLSQISIAPVVIRSTLSQISIALRVMDEHVSRADDNRPINIVRKFRSSGKRELGRPLKRCAESWLSMSIESP